jgi:hypothetical protein
LTCTEGEQAEHIHDNLDVDLADTLEGTPIKGVLIQQFPGSESFHVSATELDRVRPEQSDLCFTEHNGVPLRMVFHPHQAFVAGLNGVPNQTPRTPRELTSEPPRRSSLDIR